jgi:hypothetical protein
MARLDSGRHRRATLAAARPSRTEIAGVDFSMPPGGLARVRGVVVDEHGQSAPGAQVALVDAASGTAGAAPARQDGSFTLENVAPGDYALSAMRTNPQSGEVQMVQQTLSVRA